VVCPICNRSGSVHDSEQDFRTQSTIDAFKQKRVQVKKEDIPVCASCMKNEGSTKCVACEEIDVTFLCSNCKYLLCGKCKDKDVTCDEAQFLDINLTAESEKHQLTKMKGEITEKANG
jgi:hypothetical protein